MIGVKLSSGTAIFYEEGIPLEALGNLGIRPAILSEILNYYERRQYSSHPYILDSTYLQKEGYND